MTNSMGFTMPDPKPTDDRDPMTAFQDFKATAKVTIRGEEVEVEDDWMPAFFAGYAIGDWHRGLSIRDEVELATDIPHPDKVRMAALLAAAEYLNSVDSNVADRRITMTAVHAVLDFVGPFLQVPDDLPMRHMKRVPWWKFWAK